MVVQTPWPMGMHCAPQLNPVIEFMSGRQSLLQHSSHSEQDLPLARHARLLLALHRATPEMVFTQLALPPKQQFWLAPWPPHTSPSARHIFPPVSGPLALHRRTPSTSGA